MLKIFDAVYFKVFSLIKFLCNLLLVSIISLVFIQVFFRYVLRMPLRWSDMLLSVLFTYLAMFGLVTAVYQNVVPEITFVVKKFSKTTQKAFVVLSDILALVICIVMLIPSKQILKAAASSNILMLPMNWSQALVSFPIAMVLLSIIYLRRIFIFFSSGKYQINDIDVEGGV